jgi:uncharacterized membrane protein
MQAATAFWISLKMMLLTGWMIARHVPGVVEVVVSVIFLAYVPSWAVDVHSGAGEQNTRADMHKAGNLNCIHLPTHWVENIR